MPPRTGRHPPPFFIAPNILLENSNSPTLAQRHGISIVPSRANNTLNISRLSALDAAREASHKIRFFAVKSAAA